MARSREGAPRWYLLIHQLPPEPLYLRAKIRQRLTKVGAVALKNAVYVLPHLEECLEDFEWIAQEAIAGGGEAYVCEAQFPEPATNRALAERFRRERDADYEVLSQTIREGIQRFGRRGGAAPPEEDLPGRLSRARRRFEEIASIDFFRAKGREEAAKLLDALGKRSKPRETVKALRSRHAALSGRIWVTRSGIKVDRIASAWFIRRFLDPSARFRFIDPKLGEPRKGELRFDMVGGDFTHEADRCTFETLLARTGTRDTGLEAVAEIVHDIDLKDGKFARAEARGVEQLLSGILISHPEDEQRLDRGFALFDELYQSFRRKKSSSRKETRK